MADRTTSIRRFFFAALAWLPVAFAIWYPVRNWLQAPCGWLAAQVMTAAFPAWVAGFERDGSNHVLLTHLRVWATGGRVGELTPEAHGLVFAYGAPLLAALLLASKTRRLWWKLPAGLLALIPFQAWGICFTWLVQVAVVAGNDTRDQTGFGAWANNLIAAGYQFGFLILPTLVPVTVWLAFERRVLAAALIEGALAEPAPAART
jgi:hypothetical protein